MNDADIVIIDYGMGNLGSIKNMLKYLGIPAIITKDIPVIKNAKKIILSGVGAFDSGMQNIRNAGLIPVLNKKVLEEKMPILGICLGMQLLTRKSEEGELPGLGWISADTIKFRFDNQADKLRIPHMGWNQVQIRKNGKLFSNMPGETRFYFVHSFHPVCDNVDDVVCETSYGYPFVSG